MSNSLKFVTMSALLVIIPSSGLAQGSPNVQLLAQVDDYHSVGYNDCWGYTAPDGREYALLGVLDGTSIIDISEAATVGEVAFIPSSFSTWKDIKTYRHFAYVVTEAPSGALQIIDLSTLPDSAALVRSFSEFAPSHNISIDTANAMLYVEGSSSESVRVISLADPLNPVQVSSFGIPSHDIYARDNIAYVSEGSNHTVGIFDLSTPDTPTLLKRFGIPTNGYVHNAWLSDDGNYLMTTEETAGKTVKMWNISNFDSIRLSDEYLALPNLEIAHNTHIKGDYAYISHYKDGLRIVDISDPDSIFEVGYYDTFPGPGGIFDGAWGAFPFFASGKVLISDRTSGLFVVYFAGAQTGVGNSNELPVEFAVSPNYPNPFNPTTTINYQLSEATTVRLTIYNVLGQKIRTLVDQALGSGFHKAIWDGRSDSGLSVVSGTYIYRFEAGSFIDTNKMLLLK
ncbi:MAG: choice-of-anchor B family protein [Ignavibacteria bacterium]|nr:choice-of-anchor B family protein [Ignavibacteria bacterium]